MDGILHAADALEGILFLIFYHVLKNDLIYSV